MEKKLYRSQQNKVLAGVCGGIGEYFDIDPVIVRLLVVVFCLMGGTGIIAYIIAAIIIPGRPAGASYTYAEGEPFPRSESTGETHNNKVLLKTLGIILICVGALVILKYVLRFILPAIAFSIPMDVIFAGILIVAGVYFIAKKV
jgi:phage shock protein C